MRMDDGARDELDPTRREGAGRDSRTKMGGPAGPQAPQLVVSSHRNDLHVWCVSERLPSWKGGADNATPDAWAISQVWRPIWLARSMQAAGGTARAEGWAVCKARPTCRRTRCTRWEHGSWLVSIIPPWKDSRLKRGSSASRRSLLPSSCYSKLLHFPLKEKCKMQSIGIIIVDNDGPRSGYTTCRKPVAILGARTVRTLKRQGCNGSR